MGNDPPKHHNPGADGAGAFAEAPRIPDHELLRCIGRGSYGEVWLGRNVMGTYRAVKFVYRKTFEHERPYEREFRGIQKFEPVSRTHEGLVDILQIGRNDGAKYFYYVMELADDLISGQQIDSGSYEQKTLGDAAGERKPLPVNECIQIGLSLASAVGHLHKHGLIHRDIKPSNIIFVNGVPKLADIGLVTDVGTPSIPGGTVGYLAPEGTPSPQADIYSLGKVFYEISTGKDRQEYPELPDDWGDGTDLERRYELNEIILKACQEQSRNRYQTAEELSADLVLLQAGKSVKRLRVLERRLAALTRVGLIVLILGVLAGAAYFQNYRAKRKVTQLLAGSYIAIGARSMNEGDLAGSLPWFAQAIRLGYGDERNNQSDRIRMAAVLRECPRILGLRFHADFVSHTAFSPNGRFLATACGDGTLTLWDTESDRSIFSIPAHSNDVQSVAFSPNGQLLVTAGADKMTQVWEAKTGRHLSTLPHPERVYSAQFNPDGDKILTACEDGVARLWDLAQRTILLETPRYPKALLQSAAFSPDGKRFVTASAYHGNNGKSVAQVWDLAGMTPGPPMPHENWVMRASFSPDGRQIVTASFDTTARICDAETGQLIRILEHRLPVRSAEFSPDGRYVLTATWDFTAHLWDVVTGRQVVTPLKHSGYLMHACFSPEGRRVATATAGGVLCLWDLSPKNWLPAPAESFFGFSANSGLGPSAGGNRVFEAALNRDGTRILAIVTEKQDGGVSATAQLWDALTWKPLAAAFSCTNFATNCFLSRDGLRVAAVATNEARIWDTATGALLARLPHLANVLEVSFDPTGQRVVTSSERNAFVWDIARRSIIRTFPHSSPVTHAEFDRHGKRVLTAAGSKAQTWDVEGGQSTLTLPHARSVGYAEFSLDGRSIVTASWDSTPAEREGQVWDAQLGRATTAPLKHRDGVKYAAFSDDGTRVVTTSEDWTAQVWDASTGKALTQQLRHKNQVNRASFSPNGRWVVTASKDRTVRLWDAIIGEPLTPPLKHPWEVRRAQFTADARFLVTKRLSGETQIWPLKPDTRPVEDLILLAQLLSGHRIDQNGGALPLTREGLAQVWQQLRAKYPGEFKTSPRESFSWHEREAESSEKAREWFAARFHLDQLLKARPDDSSLRQRLGRVQRSLNNAGLVRHSTDE